MCRTHRLRVVMGLAIALGAAAVRAGEVIAHPSVGIDVNDIRLVFLGEKQLAGGLKLRPVDNLPARARFLEKVLQTDERKYEARWVRKAFRDGITAPAVKGSDAEVIAFVRATPGAVGYVESSAEGVKVLERY
jgi:hypothetical protein